MTVPGLFCTQSEWDQENIDIGPGQAIEYFQGVGRKLFADATIDRLCRW